MNWAGLTLRGLTAIVRPVPRPISIVIPTLDAAHVLGATLAGMADGIARLEERGVAVEVVVADGGSRDGTAAEARRHGARLIEAEAGRGRQLAAGMTAAEGAWLLVLHADTCPAVGWDEEVSAFIAVSANEGRAACFRFALDDSAVVARLLERLVALRCYLFALPYGDQGLLIHRSLYEALGGFRPLPMMEDVDLVRRIGRRRLAYLRTPAVTSAVRFRRAGYLPRMLRNLCCLLLFSFGVRAETVARLYG
ncbi:MAG: TIGR04283 family arsenosugar biosynthesis glycosyltransferase [Rhodospirillales bacterium]|nr:TIGR04283 family arsenosugar biosynthesis glycosyltransferase [Rhodospirillales bacterium]